MTLTRKSPMSSHKSALKAGEKKLAGVAIGDVFGKWTVIAAVPLIGKRRYWVCRCECGNESSVLAQNLKSGGSRQCADCSRVIHRMSHTPTWKVWVGMFERCRRPNHKFFHRYGGRGIDVCPEWESFEQFYADMGERPEGMSLDRIDPNGNYEKSNCRWATQKQQTNNMTNNRKITYQGVEYTHAQLAEFLGLKYHTFRSRIDRGTTIDAPLRKRKNA